MIGVVLMLGSTSCKKDGVYTPKKKINAIYLETKSTSTVTATGVSTIRTTDKHKSQEWYWDGKLLKEVRHFDVDGTTITATETYTYNGKQLIRIDRTAKAAADSYITFNYDGKWITSSEYYYSGKLNKSTIYTHTDKKISSYEETSYNYSLDSKTIAEIETSYAEMMQPIGIVAHEPHAINTAKGQGESKHTVELTWTDNNITSITTKSNGGSSTIAYTYDDKKNPYYCMYDENPCEPGMASENNMLTSTSSEGSENTYTYDGKYPVTRTMKYTITQPALTTVSEMIYTFEYKK